MKKLTVIALIFAVFSAVVALFYATSNETPVKVALDTAYESLDAAERQNLEDKFNHSSVILVVEMQSKTEKDSSISGAVKIIEVIRNTDDITFKENDVVRAFYHPNPNPADRFIFLREKYINQKVLFFGWYEKGAKSLRPSTGYMISDDINSGIDHIDEVEKKYGIEVKRELPFGAKSELAYLRKLAKEKRREETP
jgi:hypothetical protein